MLWDIVQRRDFYDIFCDVMKVSDGFEKDVHRENLTGLVHFKIKIESFAHPGVVEVPLPFFLFWTRKGEMLKMS